MPLTVEEYQRKASETAVYPREAAVLYPLLGYLGEAGELAEKLLHATFPDGPPDGWDDASLWLRQLHNTLAAVVKASKDCETTKKLIRDQAAHLPAGVLGELKRRVGSVPAEAWPGILKETGDCAWYVASLATDANASLGNILEGNLAKLAARKARGTLSGSGDNR